jgi:hypothetical protein
MNIRRLATVGFLAVAASALAAPAIASPSPYPVTEVGLTCSTTQVPANTTFTCTITSDGGTSATLTTGGSEVVSGSMTKPLNGSAPNLSATFSITSGPTAGPIAITGVVDSVQATNGATVTVVLATADTGYDGAPLAIAAGSLLVAGAGAVAFGAYRRRVTAGI